MLRVLAVQVTYFCRKSSLFLHENSDLTWSHTHTSAIFPVALRVKNDEFPSQKMAWRAGKYVKTFAVVSAFSHAVCAVSFGVCSVWMFCTLFGLHTAARALIRDCPIASCLPHVTLLCWVHFLLNLNFLVFILYFSPAVLLFLFFRKSHGVVIFSM